MIIRLKDTLEFEVAKKLIMNKFCCSIILLINVLFLSSANAQEKSLENFYNQFPDPYTKSLESILIQGDVSDVVVEEDEIIFKQEEKVLEVELTKEKEQEPSNVDSSEIKIVETDPKNRLILAKKI